MSSKDFGLGPKWWQKPGNKLQKCAEWKSDWCDPTETDGCCAIIACTYCLELEPYGGAIQYGTADFVTEGWEGTVGVYSFFGYWEKNYEGICEFVVLFNGVEVYRESCEGGQSCRDSSDETGVVIDYEDYTLRWIRHEPLPLHYVKEDETNCTVHFCDDCECSCECLCVTITEGYTLEVVKGEICNVSYPCDGPIWEGIVGDYDLSIALGRDEYGRCIITTSVNGVDQGAVLAPGCGDMAATITLEDGTTIDVICKKCDCGETQPPCCNRPLPKNCLTGVASTDPNALPLTLSVDLTATSSYGAYDCFNGSGTLTFLTPLDSGGLCCWEGRISGSCVNCNGETYNWYVDMVVCCSSSEEGWTVTAIPSLPCVLDGRESVTVPTSCDPVLLSGCYEPIVGCVTACTDTMPPTPGPTYAMCFEIYETP